MNGDESLLLEEEFPRNATHAIELAKKIISLESQFLYEVSNVLYEKTKVSGAVKKCFKGFIVWL